MLKFLINKSINKVNFFSVLFAGILLVIFMVLAIYNNFTQYKADMKALETDYLISQKKFIEQETIRALNYIKYKHKKDKDKPIEELQSEIVEVIENMRNTNDGTGYVFIYTFDGINIADPILKSNAGKNLIDFTDPNGKKVIKELIDVSQNPSGGYVNYVWNKPTTNTLEEKISYAVSYKPFRWMIGSGVYIDNLKSVVKKKKKEYLDQISRYLLQTISLVTIMYLMGLFVYKYLMNVIQNDIENISVSSKKLENIDIGKLSFREFKQVAYHINVMNENLKDLNKNLEKKVQLRTKELEESEKYSRNLVKQQDKFIKDAIHEINTPLSIIITNIDLFKLLNSNNRYLSKIEAGAKIIHNIYNDLEYMVKKDRIEYPSSNIDLSSFIESRVDFFNEIAIGNDLGFDVNLEKNKSIFFNDTHLQRICDNTLSNAIKYSFSSSNIIINLYEKEGNISLEFTNEGKTIKNVDKLFDRFYRENQSRGGFGIGLNIIKEICDKNDVVMEVESKDEITTFRYLFKKLEGKNEDITS